MKTATKVILGIALLLGAIILFGRYVGFLSITGGEFGWINYGVTSSSFTDAVASNTGLISKYWTITSLPSQYISGGDTAITLSSQTGNSRVNVAGNFKFNEDLASLGDFKIDYQTNYGGGCGTSLYSTPCPNSPPSIMGIGSLPSVGSGTIELKKNVITPNESELYINGVDYGALDASKPLYLTGYFSGNNGYSYQTLTFSNPRYKPLFDCAIDSDEVLIFDEFSSGSKVNISSLTYAVQKFCINQPPVIRSLSANGIATDTNGDILLRISQGGSYTVASDQTLRIPYITKVQNGTLRCPVSEAFNTKTLQCENILGAGTPEPTGVVVVASNIGDNQVSYVFKSDTQPLYIGDLGISVTTPVFIGNCDKSQSAPGANPSLWQTSVNGISTSSGSLVPVTNFISVEPDVYGYVSANDFCRWKDQTRWTINSIVTIDKSGLNIEKDPNINYENMSSLKVNINNQIANFQSGSGVRIKTTYLILDKVTDNYVNMTFNKGINSINIPLGKDLLGRAVVEVTPYITINNKLIFGDSALTANYNVNKTDVITNTITTTITPDPIIITKVVETTNYTLAWIVGGVALGIIVILVIFLIIRGRR